MDRLPYIEKVILSLRDELLNIDFKGLGINHKSSHSDIVTLYDTKVEHAICDAIRKEFPDDTFFTEEETKNEISNSMWIIDPIDGTSNFAVMRSNYAISVAYYENLQPVFGLVFDVYAGLLYKGVKGEGAFVNDTKLPALERNIDINTTLLDVSFTATMNLSDMYVIDFGKIAREFLGHRAFGCGALSLCHLAEGRLGYMASSKLAIWDYAAGLIILREQGGDAKCVGVRGFPIDEIQRAFLAGQSKEIFEKITKMLL